jgi:tRNA threonylcarbamoyladenosine biosynthesis protein TsaB
MNRSQVTLAIETSTVSGSAALLREGAAAAVLPLGEGMAHGRQLAPALARLLEEAGLLPAGVDLLAVGLGPGSYTGLRVGAATALGFALGTGCRLVGVSSLAAKAVEVGEEGETLLVAAPAGDEECTFAAFCIEDGLAEAMTPHAVGTWSEAAAKLESGWIIAGEGACRLGSLAGKDFEVRGESVPDAAAVGLLGRCVFERRGATPPGELMPLYLRKSKAEINWELRRKRDR